MLSYNPHESEYRERVKWNFMWLIPWSACCRCHNGWKFAYGEHGWYTRILNASFLMGREEWGASAWMHTNRCESIAEPHDDQECKRKRASETLYYSNNYKLGTQLKEYVSTHGGCIAVTVLQMQRFSKERTRSHTHTSKWNGKETETESEIYI